MSDPDRAPSRLKSRIYSALVQRQAEAGPLLGLPEVKSRGGKLCVFEELVQIAPVGKSFHRANYCRVCHARWMGENIEGAPVYWSGCPYAQFQGH